VLITDNPGALAGATGAGLTSSATAAGNPKIAIPRRLDNATAFSEAGYG